MSTVIRTGVVEVPLAMVGASEVGASLALTLRARQKKWEDVLGVEPIDGRVLWTFENGIVRIMFRYEEEEKLVGGT